MNLNEQLKPFNPPDERKYRCYTRYQP